MKLLLALSGSLIALANSQNTLDAPRPVKISEDMQINILTDPEVQPEIGQKSLIHPTANPMQERSERPPRPEEGSQQGERPQRPEQGERPQRPEQGERPQRPEQGERPQRPEQGERPQRPEQGERPQRPEQGERPQKGQKHHKDKQLKKGDQVQVDTYTVGTVNNDYHHEEDLEYEERDDHNHHTRSSHGWIFWGFMVGGILASIALIKACVRKGRMCRARCAEKQRQRQAQVVPQEMSMSPVPHAPQQEADLSRMIEFHVSEARRLEEIARRQQVEEQQRHMMRPAQNVQYMNYPMMNQRC